MERRTSALAGPGTQAMKLSSEHSQLLQHLLHLLRGLLERGLGAPDSEYSPVQRIAGLTLREQAAAWERACSSKRDCTRGDVGGVCGAEEKYSQILPQLRRLVGYDCFIRSSTATATATTTATVTVPNPGCLARQTHRKSSSAGCQTEQPAELRDVHEQPSGQPCTYLTALRAIAWKAMQGERARPSSQSNSAN
jgi:hypothetical protein